MHRHWMQHDHERRLAADLARRGAWLRHAVKRFEHMPVRALVLVDRHARRKASTGFRRHRLGVPAALALVIVVGLALPGEASAHATLVRTLPANGAVLARSPAAVRVVFDDTVRVAGGNEAIANATRASVAGGTPTAHGATLVIPLRARLGEGDYSVRWSIVSDDGHHEQGVIAFAIGTHGQPPASILTAHVSLGTTSAIFRALFFLGLLVAAGVAVFGARMRALVPNIRQRLAGPLFFALLIAFVGDGWLVHQATAGTRNALVLKIALAFAAAGAAAAALSPRVPRLFDVAAASSLVLLATPTFAGHALDRGQPRALSIPSDLAHLAAAAVWLGGLVALLWLPPRSSRDAPPAAVLKRFGRTALIAVGVLALGGFLRALTELSAVHQIWDTSYGRALLIKSALFGALVALGAANRARLANAAGVRRIGRVELLLLVAVIGVVSVLVQLQPGKQAAAQSTPVASPPLLQPAVLPPRNATVDARQLGRLAVAIARTDHAAFVTLLGSDGGGASGHDVRIDGRRAVPCGSGCYRGATHSGPVLVRVDGRPLRFATPVNAPDGTALLARLTHDYEMQRSATFDERLTSGLGAAESTRFVLVAPDSLSYVIRGGPEAVVIGARRWDRDTARARWIRSSQTPLDVMHPYWSHATNVHLVAPSTLTFLDRSIPAWFRVTVGAQSLPRQVHMTAAAHFMVDRYVGFGGSGTLSPPSR
jgi:copper transport protein